MEMYTLLYLKWVTHKDVVCGTGNSAQCHVAAWMGEGVGKVSHARRPGLWGSPARLPPFSPAPASPRIPGGIPGPTPRPGIPASSHPESLGSPP